MGPTASDVVHGVVRARQFDVETGVGRREDDVVDGCQVLVGVLLRGDQVDEGGCTRFCPVDRALRLDPGGGGIVRRPG